MHRWFHVQAKFTVCVCVCVMCVYVSVCLSVCVCHVSDQQGGLVGEDDSVQLLHVQHLHVFYYLGEIHSTRSHCYCMNIIITIPHRL